MSRTEYLAGWMLQQAVDCQKPLLRPACVFLGDTTDVSIDLGFSPSVQHDQRARRIVLRLRGTPDGHGLRLSRNGQGWSAETNGVGLLVNGRSCNAASLDACAPWAWRHHVFTLRQGSFAVAPEPDTAGDPKLASLNSRLAEQFRQLTRMARSMVPILILGETGTGKELVARAVHAQSGRPGRFVAVNCGALPETLIHSQLFGHSKGAFSGATANHDGFIRESHAGTLFLDEIGDLPPHVQSVLLRALQEREVCPVGSTRPVPVDLRIVSATNRSLETMVAQGRFREDLFARLLGFCIELPSLRDRPEDFALILRNLLRKLTTCPERLSFTPRAAIQLLRYSWPLNIRELERCLSAALVLAGDEPIDIDHLSSGIRMQLRPGRPGTSERAALNEPGAESRARPFTEEDQRRRSMLIGLLTQHDGNITAVSNATGKARMQIHRWIRRYQIDHHIFRHAEREAQDR
jgi:DNA-binding NtrC family response regulator